MTPIRPCGFHCIKIKNIGVTFGEQVVLDSVNLHVHCGSLTAIIGPNGAGKSTLVNAILGEVAHSGEVTFADSEYGALKKLNIGYVPQKLNVEKNSPVDVYDFIASLNYSFPVFLKNKKIEAEITEALAEFSAEDLLYKSLGKLSGGQLQRVMLSAAIMRKPNLLILDEPVSGIDKNGMDQFYEKMDYLRRHHDLAIILVSHDLDYVRKYADNVVLLNKTVLAQGSPATVYKSAAFMKQFGSAEFGLAKPDAASIQGNATSISAGEMASQQPSYRSSCQKAQRVSHYDPSYRSKNSEKEANYD